jgi:hypothetical protein
MERLPLRLTRVQHRLPLSGAVILSGIAGYLFWVIVRHDTTVTGLGVQAMVLMCGLYLLLIALGSLLPEDRGGFAVRGAARWVVIPAGAGAALFYIEIYQTAGQGAVLLQAIRMLVGLLLLWFIGRYDES